MGKVLPFRHSRRTIQCFVEEVREAVEAFDGDQEARRQYVKEVIRRCDALKLTDNDIAIAQLQNIFDGFLEDVGT